MRVWFSNTPSGANEMLPRPPLAPQISTTSPCFIAAPFFDAGRPYDALGQLSLRHWRASYGGALRIAWNLATIVTVDYGLSSEDTGLYINFNHIF